MGYGIATWTDNQNNLWMYGGASKFGFNNVEFNALWKYDINTNEWTWVHGSSSPGVAGIYGTQGVSSSLNTPGSRSESSATWTDTNGDLWLFGGYSFDPIEYYNDLWRYNIATNEWTWMKGSSVGNDPGVYGIQGVEDSINTPPARMVYSNWTDANGDFWLFGGRNMASFKLNDTWKYNKLTNNWTWITGGNVGDEYGYFPQLCNASALNQPASRYENRAEWTDLRGNFWFYGGDYYSGFGWNNLWMFCYVNRQWIIVNYSNYYHWGIQGVSDPQNSPGTREGGNGWLDANGYLYYYGGGYGSCNDVWRYVVDTSCGNCNPLVSALFYAPDSLCPGTCTDFINLSLNASTYLWSFPGATTPSSTDENPQSICYPTPGSYDVQLIATGTNGTDTFSLPNYITVYPSPQPQSITQSGDTLFAIAGGETFQWYFNGNSIAGATKYFYVAQSYGDYNVIVTDSNGCEAEAVIFNVYTESYTLDTEHFLIVYPNPVVNELRISYAETGSGSAIKILIYDMIGNLIVQPQTSFNSLSGHDPQVSIDVSKLEVGMYWLELTIDEKIFRTRFVKATRR